LRDLDRSEKGLSPAIRTEIGTSGNPCASRIGRTHAAQWLDSRFSAPMVDSWEVVEYDAS
jgi:hypothetical protein